MPDSVRILCDALVAGLQAILGARLFGVYVYGAAVSPDAAPAGDLDFHVILTGPLADDEKKRLKALYAALAHDFPPLGTELDGYYLLLDQARTPARPTHQLQTDMVNDAWALHRAHIHAGRCIVLYGPDPQKIYPVTTWPELEADLLDELQYVAERLDSDPAYCILNLCRLMYSFETREVVISKAEAAAWAWSAFPRWQAAIEAAQAAYAGRATPADKALMLAEVQRLYRFARQHIQKRRRGYSAGAPANGS